MHPVQSSGFTDFEADCAGQKKNLGAKFLKTEFFFQNLFQKINFNTINLFRHERRSADEENTRKVVLGRTIAEELEKLITQYF